MVVIYAGKHAFQMHPYFGEKFISKKSIYTSWKNNYIRGIWPFKYAINLRTTFNILLIFSSDAMGAQIFSALCTVHTVTNRMPKGVSTASVNKVSAKT